MLLIEWKDLLIDNIKLKNFLYLLCKLNNIYIDTNIDIVRWYSYWKSSEEKIVLSYSSLYFRHYKALTQLYNISHIKSQLANLAILNITPLIRWQKSVLIILEKKYNNILVRKLHMILLLEADFDTVNKILFNLQLIP